MKTQLTKFLSALLFAAAVSTSALGQTVPALVNYQGRLAGPDGTPLATADYQLTFRVYDSATNGSGLVWGPQVFDGVAGQGHGGKIPVVQGYFNVMLGPVDTNGVSLDTAFNATNRYVEIRVGTNNPILPRQQILSAPFAFNSAKLAGADWSAVFGTNDPVNGKFLGSKFGVGSISITNLAARQVGTNVGVGGIAWSLPTPNYYQRVTGSSFQDLTNLSVTIQTTGRPVMAMLIPSPLNNYSNSPTESIQTGFTFNPSSGNNTGMFRLVRDNGSGAVVATFGTGAGGASNVGYPSIGPLIDMPPAGTHTYKLQCGFVNPTGGVYADIYNSILVVFEL